MMKRDERLTGSLRGQSVSSQSPTHNPQPTTLREEKEEGRRILMTMTICVLGIGDDRQIL